MGFAAVFVALFAIATVVAILVRRLKIPYTVALVLTGLVLGVTRSFEPPHLSKELLYSLFLPGLLYEAAFHLEFKDFWKNKIAIHALAIPGVVGAIALTAIILTPIVNALQFVENFSFQYGLVFAALIAATDPIAVVALFKSLGAPKRLAILVEGESLLNDGTAIVFFTMILGIVASGTFSLSSVVIDFVKVVGMGMLIGGAIGYSISKVIQQVDDPLIEITLTVISAYGSFIAAEHFHFSGVIATVVAGMLSGSYAARTGMSPSTRIAVETFWEYAAFAFNSIIFLLIGFEVNLSTLIASWKPILVASLAVLIARTIVVYLSSAALNLTKEKIPWNWSAVLTWGGLRGSLSMVLALGLATDFPYRELLINMTFGVVILSIIVQGITMSPLLNKLGVLGTAETEKAYDLERANLRAASAALKEVEKMILDRAAHIDLLESLKTEYKNKQEQAEKAIKDLHIEASKLKHTELSVAKRHLLMVEKDALMQAFHDGFISQEAMDKAVEEINIKILELEESHH
jgi:CPA1 family monovalent cation:H+ antiporter